MGWIRTGIVTMGLVMVGAVGAPAARAQAPANDTFAQATVISTLPFSDTVDTTQATTDADDAEANANCGAPATEASVWYALNETTGGTRVADVSDSSYSAGVIVVTGSPGSFSLVTCGPGTVVFSATAGQTYHILAFDDTPGAGNGGTLQFSLSEVPTPEAHLTVDRTGRVDARTGVATVTGTFSCSGASRGFINVSLSQQVGRIVTVRGFGFAEVTPCDGAPHSWSVDVRPDSGKFAGGPASATADFFACNDFICGSDHVARTITLRGG